MHLSCVSSSEDNFGKWKNGGGICHESACIDSTAFLDVGAIVHSESVVASNVRIGSGTVVGPSVSIAHSTIIGYSFSIAFFIFYFIFKGTSLMHFI